MGGSMIHPLVLLQPPSRGRFEIMLVKMSASSMESTGEGFRFCRKYPFSAFRGCSHITFLTKT